MSDILRLIKWLGAAKGWTVLAVLLGVGAVAANTGLLGTASYLVSAAASHPPLIALAGALALVRLFGLARPFICYADRLVSHDVTFRLLSRLRVWLFGRLVALAPCQLLAMRSADLLTRLVRDVDEAQTVFQHLVGPFLVAVVTLGLVAGVSFTVDARLGVLAVGSLLLVGFALPLVSMRATRRWHAQLVQRRAELDVGVADTLYGLADLLAFGYAMRQVEAMSRLAETIEQLQLRLASIAGFRAGAQDALVRFGAWSLLLVGISLVQTQRLDANYLVVLPIALFGAMEAFEPLIQAAQRLGGARASSARIWTIADRRPALAFPAESARVQHVTTLEFERVSFTYDGPPVLDDISFTLRRGQAIGIVGPSGAGKSSVLQLAVRAWDPTSGHVYMNSRDLREFSSAPLASTIGLLTQDSYIFSSSPRENLQLARPDATAQEMERALCQVGLGELLMQLPSGLDTWLGEQSARLSGGERQRLALARILLLDAPFILFDEPTANLDPMTERAIMRVIRDLRRTRGVLLVTHRLVDLDWLDELLVLEAGRIVERGRPGELRHTGGLYARLADVQDQLLDRA